MLEKIIRRMKEAAVRFQDAIFWKVDPDLCWWKGDLTMKERAVRLLKQLDAWLLDLIYPDVGQDDDPPWYL